MAEDHLNSQNMKLINSFQCKIRPPCLYYKWETRLKYNLYHRLKTDLSDLCVEIFSRQSDIKNSSAKLTVMKIDNNGIKQIPGYQQLYKDVLKLTLNTRTALVGAGKIEVWVRKKNYVLCMSSSPVLLHMNLFAVLAWWSSRLSMDSVYLHMVFYLPLLDSWVYLNIR